MASRGQSLTLSYVAWDTSANAGKTGDAANHTLRWVKDGTSAAPTNSPSEVDATNAPGVYTLALTAAECTCNVGVLCGKSATANVVLMPITITFEQLPTAAAGASGGLPTVDANNRIAGIQGSKTTLDALNDPSAATIAAAVLDEAKGSHTGLLATALPAAAPGSSGGLPTVDGSNQIAGIQGTITNLNNLDAAVSSRLAAAGYTAPDNAAISAIKAKTDKLPNDPASNTVVNTRLAAADYIVPARPADVRIAAGD